MKTYGVWSAKCREEVNVFPLQPPTIPVNWWNKINSLDVKCFHFRSIICPWIFRLTFRLHSEITSLVFTVHLNERIIADHCRSRSTRFPIRKLLLAFPQRKVQHAHCPAWTHYRRISFHSHCRVTQRKHLNFLCPVNMVVSLIIWIRCTRPTT